MAIILIAEDEPSLRDRLCNLLTSVGHRVIEAVDGEDGIEQARQHSDIQLVISDFNMPKVNGIKMCQAIHQMSAFETIPMFILSTETSETIKAEARAAGIYAWIAKPYVDQSVLNVVNKALKRASSNELKKFSA